ncbi:MAG: tryptophan synthase subunit alpha [Kurthia sp.]|nr:tryptophan synthase subunit alpha [Candidatus Kurthia equi]
MTKTLQIVIEALTATGEKAFIPYIMAGDGGFEKTREAILYLQDQGATAIEIGIPFSDPVADGPVIEAAGIRALKEGANLQNILALLQLLKPDVSIPLIIMTYLNPIIRYGIANFVKDAEAANIKGLIIPDMPMEESSLLTDYTATTDISLIQLVSLTSPKERMAKITKQAEGFVYAVTVNGTTGEKKEFGEALQTHLKQLKQTSQIPVLAGFGISTYETAIEMGKEIDGVIVGSTIVDALHRGDEQTIASFFQNKTVEALK